MIPTYSSSYVDLVNKKKVSLLYKNYIGAVISHILPQSAGPGFLTLSVSIKRLTLAQMLCYIIDEAP